jgi:hypothetical protein
MVPATHRLAPLLGGGKREYLGNLSLLLGKPLYEISNLARQHGFIIDARSDKSRLMFYLLLESYYECDDMGGAWHMARNKLRQLDGDTTSVL